MRAIYLDAIKSFEGFTRHAKWDYAQNTNGFGTKALYANEKIDEAEANRRFAAEIEQARQFVEKHSAGWDEGTKAALTSLTFNAGTRWASSGLGDAVRNFDVDAVREKFLSYTKAGGQDLPGLVRRRFAEASWIGTPSAGAIEAAPAVASDGANRHRGVSPPNPLAWSASISIDALRTADPIAKFMPDEMRPDESHNEPAALTDGSTAVATTISAAALLMLALELRSSNKLTANDGSGILESLMHNMIRELPSGGDPHLAARQRNPLLARFDGQAP